MSLPSVTTATLVAVLLGAWLPWLLVFWIYRRSRERERIDEARQKDYSFTLRIHENLRSLCGLPYQPNCFINDHYRNCLPYLTRAQGYPPWHNELEVLIDPRLSAGEYQIHLTGLLCARGHLEPDKLLVSLDQSNPFEGCPQIQHPVTEAPACWISPQELPTAWSHQLLSESPLEILVHHLRLSLVRNLERILHDNWLEALVHGAILDYPSLRAQSALLTDQSQRVAEIVRLSLRTGCSILDLEGFLGLLARGLAEEKSTQVIVQELREQFPAGTPSPDSDVPEVGQAMLRALCLESKIFSRDELPVALETLGQQILQGRSLSSEQMLDVFGQLQFRNPFSKTNSELRELLCNSEDGRTPPPSERLASILLALPKHQASQTLHLLNQRLDARAMEELIGSLGRLAFGLKSFSAPSHVLDDVFFQPLAEDFLDYCQPVPAGNPARLLDPDDLDAYQFQNLAYQLERLYFPVLHWKTNLETIFSHPLEGTERLLEWHQSGLKRMQRARRAWLALSSLPQPLQTMLRVELTARGCDLDARRPADPSEALVCELEMLTRLGTRLR